MNMLTPQSLSLCPLHPDSQPPFRIKTVSLRHCSVTFTYEMSLNLILSPPAWKQDFFLIPNN